MDFKFQAHREGLVCVCVGGGGGHHACESRGECTAVSAQNFLLN
jgi:hypothetical protein